MNTVRLNVSRPEKLSRAILILRTILGWIYVGIPHGVCLFFAGIVAEICAIIAWFAVLFTGRYPKGLFDFVVGTLDWQNRVSIYMNFLRDEYPTFGFVGEYPAKFSVQYPEKLSRALLVLRGLFGWLYVGIPHSVCLSVRYIAHVVVTIIAWFAVLFTGKMPEWMFEFMVGTYRWMLRVYAYAWFLTDEYPPFTGGPAPGSVGTGISA